MRTVGKIVLWLLLAIVVLLVIGWFALQRPDTPYATLDAKYANAESEFMGLPGGLRAHYRDEGNPDGPVLVMVHGFSASLHTWEPWVERLKTDYRIISLDLPGHGLTRAPEGYAATMPGFADHVDAVTGRLGVTRFTLIGNSMGGGVAWDYALKHPQKLDGLVLVGAAGWPEEGPQEDEPMVFKMLANPVGRALLGKLDSTEMVRGGLRAAFEPTPDMADDAMVERYVQMARAPGHRDIIVSLMTGYAERPVATKEKLAAITTPTLIMHGDTDKLIPVGDADKFADAIPGSTLIIYEQTGHVPMEQIADKSAADLKQWLETKAHPSPLAGEGGPRSGSDEGAR
jgi:pimeloyl-ACP methyl ester carboxylesterase